MIFNWRIFFREKVGLELNILCLEEITMAIEYVERAKR